MRAQIIFYVIYCERSKKKRTSYLLKIAKSECVFQFISVCFTLLLSEDHIKKCCFHEMEFFIQIVKDFVRYFGLLVRYWLGSKKLINSKKVNLFR